MRYKRGELSQSEYEAAIDVQIADSIKLQEELGLDVLVHGEFERTDMVEFFGQQLSGFAFTENGWVQSYGSRYVRPPIIYGDVVRTAPMTVREFKVAQSLTEKPVKRMLTAPVTILNWSYPRTDISRSAIDYKLSKRFLELDPAGYFIIYLDRGAGLICAKHFTNEINEQGLAIDPETGKPIPATVKFSGVGLSTYFWYSLAMNSHRCLRMRSLR